MRRLPILAMLLVPVAAGQTAASREAVKAMQRGDFAAAERLLRTEVQAHPGDAWALSLLGVALDNEKKIPEAEEFHRAAVARSPHSAEILTNYGTHLWTAGQYGKAESLFAEALSATPTFFTALFNLGVMATYTGHYDRAREALTSALEMRPQSVDVLVRLAAVEQATGQWESAVLHLAQAAKLNPRRSDVFQQLALAATGLGALADAADAWGRYLELQPDDEIARRERAYAWAGVGQVERATSDLEQYTARHTDDPVGYYELGQAERTVDIGLAMAHLDKALALQPDYAAALTARGALYYQQGKPELAVGDLERAASLRPDDAANLDRLGQVYQSLERPSDAVRSLRRAVELAPGDPKTIFHFGRALADAGQAEESKAVMDRFRQLGPEPSQGVPAGLVDYLSLAPEQRKAEFRSRVKNAVRERPDDPAAQVEYLRVLLDDGKSEEAAAVAKHLGGRKANGATLALAGHALLASGSDSLARNLLEQASAAGADVTLDLALATLHAAGPSIDATALERTLQGAGSSPDLYRREAAFLVKQQRPKESLHLIDTGARAFPENREILLMKATTLDLAGQGAESDHLLEEIQRRWPEWSIAWLAHGILLNIHRQYESARTLLETALALGAKAAEVYFYLADCLLRAGRKGDAEDRIEQALKIAGDDASVQLLAGRIAYASGRYQLAVDRETAALRLRPQWSEAYRRLAEANGALGRKHEADSAMAAAAKLAQPEANDTPPFLTHLYEGGLLPAAR